MRIWGGEFVVMCRSVPAWSTRVFSSWWRVTPMVSPCLPVGGGVLEDGLADHFLDGRQAVADLLQAGLAQGDHPFVHGLLLELHGRGAGEDQLADLVRDLHDLVEPHASPVARVVAARAAASLAQLEAADVCL